MDGTTQIGSAHLSGGAATLTTGSLAVGSHSFTAVYGGDGNFITSASSAVADTVNKDSTGTALTSSSASPTFGQAVTFTATVSGAAPGAGTPTGTITFYDGSTKLGSSTLSAGKATFTAPTLQVAAHSVTASYGGDGNFTGSTSTATLVTVGCTVTLTGKITGNITVTSGATCLNGASVGGGVTVSQGAALYSGSSSIGGKLSSSGATAVTLCGTTVGSGATVSGTTGFVLLGSSGDDANAPCAGDTIKGGLTLSGNLNQVEVGGASVTGALSLTNSNGTGPDAGHSTSELEGNTISAGLSCSGNSPAPINDGQPNHVTGVESGQCSGL
jgi:hypothetical protein